jgi:hypothetical protein
MLLWILLINNWGLPQVLLIRLVDILIFYILLTNSFHKCIKLIKRTIITVYAIFILVLNLRVLIKLCFTRKIMGSLVEHIKNTGN